MIVNQTAIPQPFPFPLPYRLTATSLSAGNLQTAGLPIGGQLSAFHSDHLEHVWKAPARPGNSMKSENGTHTHTPGSRELPSETKRKPSPHSVQLEQCAFVLDSTLARSSRVRFTLFLHRSVCSASAMH